MHPPWPPPGGGVALFLFLVVEPERQCRLHYRTFSEIGRAGGNWGNSMQNFSRHDDYIHRSLGSHRIRRRRTAREPSGHFHFRHDRKSHRPFAKWLRSGHVPCLIRSAEWPEAVAQVGLLRRQPAHVRASPFLPFVWAQASLETVDGQRTRRSPSIERGEFGGF